MLLTHLSLQRVGYRKTPRVLTNAERVRAYRAMAPVEFANSVFNYGANAQVDAQWTECRHKTGSRTGPGLKPGIDAGRSTLSPLPARQPPPDNNKVGGQGSTFEVSK